jgi:protein-tyrosine phosphatase
MIPQVYRIATNELGLLAVMARPRSGDWLRDELRGLGELGYSTVVSLLEPRESTELELGSEGEIAKDIGLNFVNFPVPDRSTPGDTRAFRRFAAGLAADIREGRGVVIHCRAGIGRSGLTAAAVLVELGHDPREVFTTLSKARGIEVPDTAEQAEWFQKNCIRPSGKI